MYHLLHVMLVFKGSTLHEESILKKLISQC